MAGHRAFTHEWLFASALMSVLACSSSTGNPDAAAGAAGTAGSSGAGALGGGGGSGAVGGVGGSSGSSGGMGASGGAGGSATGGSAGSTGGSGGTGMSSGGAGGSEGLDCSTLGESCIEICEAGACACDCSSAVPCPLELPTADAECESSTEICFYEERTSCNSLWQCHQEHWVMLERGACPSSDDALCPDSAEAYVAEATCPPSGCVYDGVVCSCSPPSCSGVQQDPQPTCAAVVPAVCREALVDNAACAPIGTRCGTMCCGLGWECTTSGWQSTDYPCPP